MDGLLWAWAHVLAKVVQSDSTVRRLPASWAFASPPLYFTAYSSICQVLLGALKCEMVHLKHYPARAAAQDDIFVYLEAFYNTIRPHSALGWRSPASFEAELAASAT